MMIRFTNATNDDIAYLKELWLEAFGEKLEAIELFFERKYTPEITYVAKDEDKLVAMLYLLPSSVNGLKACYLFAVATAKAYRSQGIMSKLIDFALSKTDAQLCVTLPASESLYTFYEKLGFNKLTAKTAELSREQIVALSKPYPVQDLVVNNYTGIRNRVLKADFLFWNNDHIQYNFDYNKLYGGKIIKSNYGYAIAFEEDGVCSVSEIICHDSNMPKLFTDLLNEFSSKEFKFHLSPNQCFIDGTDKTYGMVKCLSDYKPQNIYCGLTLD